MPPREASAFLGSLVWLVFMTGCGGGPPPEVLKAHQEAFDARVLRSLPPGAADLTRTGGPAGFREYRGDIYPPGHVHYAFTLPVPGGGRHHYAATVRDGVLVCYARTDSVARYPDIVMALEESWGTEFSDAPNYLLLAALVTGRRPDHLHGGLFCSLDPEALGRALAVALAHTTYGDAYAALLGMGWTPHTPAGAGVRATALAGVVRDLDVWVAVGYSPAWRPVSAPYRAVRPALPAVPRDPLIAAGVGRGQLLAAQPAPWVPAHDVRATAQTLFLTLRLQKLL